MDNTVDLLQELNIFFQKNGFQTELIAPNQTTPFYILVVRLNVFSSYIQFIDFQMYFLPNKFPEFNILQTFIELSGKISDEYLEEIKKVIRKLNFIASVGSYGISDSKTIYFKHGNVIPLVMNTNHAVTMIDQQTGVIFHQIKTYLDQLLDVSVGKLLNHQVFLNSPDF